MGNDKNKIYSSCDIGVSNIEDQVLFFNLSNRFSTTISGTLEEDYSFNYGLAEVKVHGIVDVDRWHMGSYFSFSDNIVLKNLDSPLNMLLIINLIPNQKLF